MTVVNPDNVEVVAPNATFVVPIVIELFVSDELPIFDNVFVEPLIDLLVSVSDVFVPTKVVVEVGNVIVPVFVMLEITGDVSVLLLNV